MKYHIFFIYFIFILLGCISNIEDMQHSRSILKNPHNARRGRGVRHRTAPTSTLTNIPTAQPKPAKQPTPQPISKTFSLPPAIRLEPTWDTYTIDQFTVKDIKAILTHWQVRWNTQDRKRDLVRLVLKSVKRYWPDKILDDDISESDTNNARNKNKNKNNEEEEEDEDEYEEEQDIDIEDSGPKSHKKRAKRTTSHDNDVEPTRYTQTKRKKRSKPSDKEENEDEEEESDDIKDDIPHDTPNKRNKNKKKNTKNRRDTPNNNDDQEESEEESSYDSTDRDSNNNNNRRRRGGRRISYAAFSGFSAFRHLDNFKRKITGRENEDIVEILGDINHYAHITDKDDKTMYRWMVTNVLAGTAKAAYRNKYRLEPDLVDTYKKLSAWLYDKFDGALRVDKKFRRWKNCIQYPTETPRSYHTRYDNIIESYKCAVNYALDHAERAQTQLITVPTESQIFTTFINNLYPPTQQQIRSYINIHNLPEHFSTIKPAVEFAEKQLNPAHGIKVKGRAARQFVQRRDRLIHQPYIPNNQPYHTKKSPYNHTPTSYDTWVERGKRNQRYTRGRGSGRSRGWRGSYRGYYTPYQPQYQPQYHTQYQTQYQTPYTPYTPNQRNRGFRGRGRYRNRGRARGRYNKPYNNNYNNKNYNNRNNQIRPTPTTNSLVIQPQTRPRRKTPDRTCWKCGSTTHIKAQCPQNNKNNNNNNNNTHQLSLFQNDTTTSEPYPAATLLALDTLETALTPECSESVHIPLFLQTKQNQDIKQYTGFLDTGASITILSLRFLQKCGIEPCSGKIFNCRTGNGIRPVKQYIDIDVSDQDYVGDPHATSFKHRFFILDKIPFDIIVGRGLMKKLRYRIVKLEREVLRHKSTTSNVLTEQDNIFYDKLLMVPHYKPEQNIEIAKQELELIDHHIMYVQQQTLFPKPVDIDKLRSIEVQQDLAIYPIDVETKYGTNIDCGEIQNPQIRRRFWETIKRYDTIVAKHWADCGKIEGISLKLELKPDTKPWKRAPYSQSYKLQEECRRQITRLLEADFIEPSNSEFASPVLFVPKKNINGTIEWRMCVDYRELNKNTVKDLYPLPNINDLYRKFHGKKYFTVLDLRHGYHHIIVFKPDRFKTAFITPIGLYQQKRMGFGFVNAPATFQRAMDEIFRGLDFVVVYLDDILILADTEEEMMHNIEIVLDKLYQYNAKIRVDKCKFFKRQLKYLGHFINQFGQKPDPEYVKRIIDIARPRDKKQIERFAGLVNWLGRYIPHLSTKIEPINKLRRKNVQFIWGPKQEKAFKDIKKSVETADIIRHPDLNKTFFVICDASDIAAGAVLLQKYDTMFYPVEFYSRIFDQNQRNWHVSEKEIISVVWALEKWHRYLLPKHFHVFTDHRNLVELINMETNKVKKSKLNRWLIRIQEYDFTAHYITGAENVVADYLSRDAIPRPKKFIDVEPNQFLFKNTTKTTKFTTLHDIQIYATSTKPQHHILNLDALLREAERLHQLKQQKQNKNKKSSRDASDTTTTNKKQYYTNKTTQKSKQKSKPRSTLIQQRTTKTTRAPIFEGTDIETDTDEEENLYNNKVQNITINVDWNHIINLDIISTKQKEDAILRALIQQLKSPNSRIIRTLPRYIKRRYKQNQFKLLNDILVKNDQTNAIFIPATMRTNIIQYFHKNATALHQSPRRIYKLMRSQVFWFGMYADIKIFVKKCEVCNLAKKNPIKDQGYLQLFPPKSPFDIIEIDIVGPLPVTRDGYRYILTVMDRFSRFVRCLLLRTVTASNIAVELRKEWLLKYGIPNKILSDRGVQFTSAIFVILCSLFGIDKLFSTAYHPQTNGMIERFHRFLKERLRCIASEKQLDFAKYHDWDTFIPEIEFAYNISTHTATKFSPYDIIYGDIVKTPSQRILNANIDRIVENTTNTLNNKEDAEYALKISPKTKEYIKLIKEHRSRLLKEIKANMKKYDIQRKQYYDKNRKEPTKYEIGEKVVVDASVGKCGNIKKLNIHRKPSIILDKINDNAYVVRYEDGKTEKVNIERIYKGTSVMSGTQTDKNILARRNRRNRRYR